MAKTQNKLKSRKLAKVDKVARRVEKAQKAFDAAQIQKNPEAEKRGNDN